MQTAIDLNPRYTMPECEFLYTHFSKYNSNARIVKDQYGLWVNLFYSDNFLINKLNCIIVK